MMITNASRMYQAPYHPCSNPERSRQKHRDNVTEPDNKKGIFESTEMDKESKSV